MLKVLFSSLTVLTLFTPHVFAQINQLPVQWPLTEYSPSSSILSGKIDLTKLAPGEKPEDIEIRLYYTDKSPFPAEQEPSLHSAVFVEGKASTSQGSGKPFLNTQTGEYFLELKNLTPGTTYYLAQRVSLGTKVDIRTDKFDSKLGIMTQAESADDEERRSYRLLAPFPGLAVLYDPDLCEQLIREGRIPEDYPLCSTGDPSGFNGFLNYAFKLLIGITAVLLVLRIMIEGYKYATTDIPFVSVNAKTKLGESIAGLLLALSAYLILNTINPQLVENGVETKKLTVTVNEPEYEVLSPQQLKTLVASYTDVGKVTGDGIVMLPGIFKNMVTPLIEGKNSQVRPIKGIVMHGTAGGFFGNTKGNEAILYGWISKAQKESSSSAHFVIDRDGTIWQTVRLNKYANHFLTSNTNEQGKKARNENGISLGLSNRNTIGIEIVQGYDPKKGGWEPITQAQVNSTIVVVNFLLQEFKPTMTKENIYGHGQVGVDRTADEGLDMIARIKPYLK